MSNVRESNLGHKAHEIAYHCSGEKRSRKDDRTQVATSKCSAWDDQMGYKSSGRLITNKKDCVNR